MSPIFAIVCTYQRDNSSCNAALASRLIALASSNFLLNFLAVWVVGGVDIIPAVFQIASDLHTEFHATIDPIKITPSAPYLILAGDIGIPHVPTYEQLLARESQRFHTVFIVAGNHEFYQGEYHAAKEACKKICAKFPNVVFMDKTSYWLSNSNIRVLGTTLWSFVPKENAQHVANGLNDYRLIKLGDRLLTVEDTVTLFMEEATWLQKEIQAAKSKNEPVIVITHHAPLTKGTSHPQYLESLVDCAFATDMTGLMGDPVKAWVFGHTVRFRRFLLCCCCC